MIRPAGHSGEARVLTGQRSRSGAVTPIATATGRPGKPIKVGGDGPEAIVIAP
jgi:hypothetical protein